MSQQLFILHENVVYKSPIIPGHTAKFTDKESMSYRCKQMNKLFLILMAEATFGLRHHYYRRLRLLGRIYNKTKKQVKRWLD